MDDNVNHNLGIHAIVNGVDVGDMSSVLINTASSTTHTIEYYAVDQAGNRGSMTRTVIVGGGSSEIVAVSIDSATSTPEVSDLGETATTTPQQ